MSEQIPDGFAEAVVAQLESLQGQVDALTAAAAAPSVWPTPASDLAEWVEGWLVPTFDMGVDVRDWQNIPALVSELSALWVGYSTMTGPKAGGFDPLVWHSHLASARTRMAEHSKRARHRETRFNTER